jgi:phage regulator Rha-like protein
LLFPGPDPSKHPGYKFNLEYLKRFDQIERETNEAKTEAASTAAINIVARAIEVKAKKANARQQKKKEWVANKK